MKTVFLLTCALVAPVAACALPTESAIESVDSQESAQTSDAWDPNWLQGSPITKPEAARWFAPGSTYAVLGHWDMRVRHRSCNATTGCAGWYPEPTHPALPGHI